LSTGYNSAISYQVIQKRDFSSSVDLKSLTMNQEETGSVFTFKQPTE
jgi:hypothetical protein